MFQRAHDLSRNGPGPGRGRSTLRGEGRLVDRGIKVQALGRGSGPVARRDCAVASDRFRSRAPVGGEMDRVTQRLHIDRVVLLVNAGHRMCCRRYGHDHRDHQGA